MKANPDEQKRATYQQTAAKLAVSYARVSTREQAERGDGDPEGYSLPAQLEANRRKAFIHKCRWSSQEFVERGESAKFADTRPELQRCRHSSRSTPSTTSSSTRSTGLARNRLDDARSSLADQRRLALSWYQRTENIDETPLRHADARHHELDRRVLQPQPGQ